MQVTVEGRYEDTAQKQQDDPGCLPIFCDPPAVERVKHEYEWYRRTQYECQEQRAGGNEQQPEVTRNLPGDCLGQFPRSPDQGIGEEEDSGDKYGEEDCDQEDGGDGRQP